MSGPNEQERPDLAPQVEELTPGYVRVPGGGDVHIALVLAGAGIAGWLLWRLMHD